MEVDIAGAQFRNKDHDCQLNRKVIGAAQGYQESTDPLINSAAELYVKEYDPTAIPAQQQVYYAPHIPGKPESFQIQYRFDYNPSLKQR